MIYFGFRTNTEQLRRFPAAMQRRASMVVRKTAFAIERNAKTLAMQKGVHDTGAGIASIYTLTDRSSGFGKAYSIAAGLWAQRHPGTPFPMSDNVRPSNDPLSAYVVVGARYMIYHEYGTVYMRARRFLRPAANMERENFGRDMRAALRSAGGDVGAV